MVICFPTQKAPLWERYSAGLYGAVLLHDYDQEN